MYLFERTSTREQIRFAVQNFFSESISTSFLTFIVPQLLCNKAHGFPHFPKYPEATSETWGRTPTAEFISVSIFINCDLRCSGSRKRSQHYSWKFCLEFLIYSLIRVSRFIKNGQKGIAEVSMVNRPPMGIPKLMMGSCLVWQKNPTLKIWALIPLFRQKSVF